MRFQHFYLLLAWVVLATGQQQQQQQQKQDECLTTSTSATTPTSEPDPPCNCDALCGVIGLDNRAAADDEDDPEGLRREDSDNDGDPTICARNREMKLRTFHSVCHMNCHNSCTIFRVFKMLRHDKEVSYVASYRNTFYKLHEGAC